MCGAPGVENWQMETRFEIYHVTPLSRALVFLKLIIPLSYNFEAKIIIFYDWWRTWCGKVANGNLGAAPI